MAYKKMINDKIVTIKEDFEMPVVTIEPTAEERIALLEARIAELEVLNG